MFDKSRTVHRLLFMIGLVVAGEAVFALPFHVARFFRPTVLEVFALTNTELGAAQGIYGILAMLAYFPGGPLADRFPARKLLAFSLWMTAAGGLYMATFPGYRGALILWGFFGVSTILLFWAALIRATRDWGGNDDQGRAFGLLDSGRGLLAAVLASIAVVVFGFFFPEGYSSATFEEKKQALRIVIHGYTAATVLAGLFVWFVISDGHPAGKETSELLLLHQRMQEDPRLGPKVEIDGAFGHMRPLRDLIDTRLAKTVQRKQLRRGGDDPVPLRTTVDRSLQPGGESLHRASEIRVPLRFHDEMTVSALSVILSSPTFSVAGDRRSRARPLRRNLFGTRDVVQVEPLRPRRWRREEPGIRSQVQPAQHS